MFTTCSYGKRTIIIYSTAVILITNHATYATRDSACSILRHVYFKAYHITAAGDLEQALDDLPSKACVADSILLVAENEGGGKYVTIETNCEDTVCIVLLNSSKNLHGLIKGGGKDDLNAYCTRIIPFITTNIYHYLKNNPNDSPINDYKS